MWNECAYDAYSNGFIFWKGGKKYFFSLALNNDKFLYENEYKAFDTIIQTVFTVTQQKNKLDTVQWKKPRKWNVIED